MSRSLIDVLCAVSTHGKPTRRYRTKSSMLTRAMQADKTFKGGPRRRASNRAALALSRRASHLTAPVAFTRSLRASGTSTQGPPSPSALASTGVSPVPRGRGVVWVWVLARSVSLALSVCVSFPELRVYCTEFWFPCLCFFHLSVLDLAPSVLPTPLAFLRQGALLVEEFCAHRVGRSPRFDFRASPHGARETLHSNSTLGP